MYWDDAFFARSKIEPLMWDEDPGDHPLMAETPKFLFARAKAIVGAVAFATRRSKAAPRPVRINVVRHGKRRRSVPLNLSA